WSASTAMCGFARSTKAPAIFSAWSLRAIFEGATCMAFETILLDIHGKVGLITLNRPQALNALNAQIVSEINQALDQLEKDPNIGCVVLTGSAKAFAAGADIKEMAELAYPQIYVDDLFSDADRIANRR